jgi:hypothetical protein
MTTTLSLTTQVARPSGTAWALSEVPDEATLLELDAAARERLLAGLALAWLDAADDDAARAPLTATVGRVLSLTTRVTFEATLAAGVFHRSLGAIVEAAGLEVVLTQAARFGWNVNDLLARSDTVPRRGLTERECGRLTELFGPALDPRTVRFHFTGGVATMGSSAITLGNTITLDPGDSRLTLAPGTTLPVDPTDDGWDSFNSVVLAHEPTHVWSYQHRGSRYAVDSVAAQVAGMVAGSSRNAAYAYQPTAKHVLDFGEEQRAMLMQDYATARAARRNGKDRVYSLGLGSTSPDAVLAALEPYVRQLRALGPGQPQPPGVPEPVLCVCGTDRFAQDGAAGLLGEKADEFIAGVGRYAKERLLTGVSRRDPGALAVGLVGVGGAVAASLLGREQGGTGGGSAILDQAGLPHGVSGQRDGLSGSATLKWDAPVRAGTLGASNTRLELRGGLETPVGPGTLTTDAEATLDFEGRLARAELGASYVSPDVDAHLHGQVTSPGPGRLRAQGDAGLSVGGVTTAVSGGATLKGGQVQAFDAHARIDAPTAFGAVDVEASRGHPGLSLTQATLALGVTPEPSLALSGQATVVPKGLDALSLTVSGRQGEGQVALTGYGRDLTTAPTVGVQVAAGTEQVSVTASAETTPSTGATQGMVGVAVKLP